MTEIKGKYYGRGLTVKTLGTDELTLTVLSDVTVVGDLTGLPIREQLSVCLDVDGAKTLRDRIDRFLRTTGPQST